METVTSPTPTAEVRSRVSRPPVAEAAGFDEALVADARAGLTPAQMVERKLHCLLRSKALPVSHLMTAPRNGRGPAPSLQ